MNNIVLIGPMGSGKSTIGRLLAKKMNVDFFDTDEVLESRTGVSISTIFEIEGESGFRERESKLIDEFRDLDGVVIATGGGAVLAPENRENLRKMGQVIYLHASLEILFERTQHSKNRPLLSSGDIKEKLRLILADRSALYEDTAHHIVETGVLSPADMLLQIASLVTVGE